MHVEKIGRFTLNENIVFSEYVSFLVIFLLGVGRVLLWLAPAAK